MSKILRSYIVDSHDWPLRYVAVIITGQATGAQKSCMTYWGAQRWMKRTTKRIESGEFYA